jgi:hypothetical protein
MFRIGVFETLRGFDDILAGHDGTVRAAREGADESLRVGAPGDARDCVG